MPQDPTIPVVIDRAGRLNAALLAKGKKAVTTDAAGSIDIPMLLGTLQAIGMAIDASGPDGTGIITVTISKSGRAPGERSIAASVRGYSRSSAIVEAAIAALMDLPGGTV
jgi:hypothetical protein